MAALRMVIILCQVIISTLLHEAASEGPVCDEGWIYHPGSNTCLQIKLLRRFSVRHNDEPCSSEKGGEYRNISGKIFEITKHTEPFAKEYLKYSGLSRSLFRINRNWLSHNGYHEYRRVIDHSRYMGPFRRDSDTILIQFGMENQPATLLVLPDYYTEAVICQVESGSSSTELPSCPRNVTVANVSDNAITLTLDPGEVRSPVIVRLVPTTTCGDSGNDSSVSICVPPKSRTERVFLLTSQNLTVSGLQENTSYRIQFQTEGTDTVDCNETLTVTTTEAGMLREVTNVQELPLVLIGLAVTQAISGIVILILTALCCRNFRKTHQAVIMKSSPSTGATVKDVKISFTKEKAKHTSDVSQRAHVTQNLPDTKQEVMHEPEHEYGNVAPLGPSYDKMEDTMDDHIYEI